MFTQTFGKWMCSFVEMIRIWYCFWIEMQAVCHIYQLKCFKWNRMGKAVEIGWLGRFRLTKISIWIRMGNWKSSKFPKQSLNFNRLKILCSNKHSTGPFSFRLAKNSDFIYFGKEFTETRNCKQGECCSFWMICMYNMRI